MAKKKAAKRLPKQKTLPGMQDRRVVALENAALKYADVRDERMGWTKKEVEAKKRVQDLMHTQGRKHYSRANIEISLEPEDEKVIVRVRDREQAQDVDEPAKAPIEEPEDEEDDEVPEPENPDDYDSQPGQGAKNEPPSEF